MSQGVDITCELDAFEACELRPGEFSVCWLNRNNMTIGVSPDFGLDPCDDGPIQCFRRRGGGLITGVGDICTRVRSNPEPS